MPCVKTSAELALAGFCCQACCSTLERPPCCLAWQLSPQLAAAIVLVRCCSVSAGCAMPWTVTTTAPRCVQRPWQAVLPSLLQHAEEASILDWSSDMIGTDSA